MNLLESFDSGLGKYMCTAVHLLGLRQRGFVKSTPPEGLMAPSRR